MENHSEGVSLARMSSQLMSAASGGIVSRGDFGMRLQNTPQKTLESWKQIAAYLERSERTVRRWEATEGLPVHRREHEKQDTVFAFRHEIEAWSRVRTTCAGAIPDGRGRESPNLQAAGQRLPRRTRLHYSHHALLH